MATQLLETIRLIKQISLIDNRKVNGKKITWRNIFLSLFLLICADLIRVANTNEETIRLCTMFLVSKEREKERCF